MADQFKSSTPGSKIWNPINSYDPNVCDKIPESVSSASSPLAMLAEQVRRKRSESSRNSPSLENSSVIRMKSESQAFPSHPSVASTLEGDECALDLSTKNSRQEKPLKNSSKPPLPVVTAASESSEIIGPVFSLAKLHSDSSQSGQSFSDESSKKSFTGIKQKSPVTPKSEAKKKSPMSPPVSSLRNSPLYKKRKVIPKSPLATARRLKLNPDLSQSTPTSRSLPSKSSQSHTSSPTKTNSVLSNKHTGHTVKRMPTGEPIKWLKRVISLPPHNNKKKSYKLLKTCTPCCVVLSKLPLETDKKSLELASCSTRLSQIFTDCTKICWKEYGKVHSPWIKALHQRMKRLFAVLLWGQTPKFVSIRMEPLVKTPKPPKSQPRRGPSLQSATPGKRRFFLLELKRKTILIPVVGNQMGQRAFELDNPKNIGILYNIAASLQKSSSGDD